MKKILIPLIGLLAIALSADLPNHYNGSRTPSSSHRAQKIGKMYDYKGWLAVPPIRYVAGLIVKKKLSKYLDQLPLAADVKERLRSHIHSKAFSHQLIPFLLALKDLYTPEDSAESLDFKKHIIKAFPNRKMMPGLEHDLFSYDEKATPQKGGKSSNGIIAMVLTFYDAIILQNSDFGLGSYPEITSGTRDRVRSLVIRALDERIRESGPNNPITAIIREIRNDQAQVDGIVETSIDFFYRYSSELSEMFTKRYAEKEALRNWMQGELSTRNQGALWKFAKSNLDSKPFAVQIIVDGLQGHLIEGLASADPNNVFLNKVNDENNHHEKFKPRVPVNFHDKKIHADYLNHILNTDYSSSPAYLPFFKNLYRESSAGIPKSGVTTTPTTSGRNLPMIASGAPATGPGGTGIPNFSFLDRDKENAFYFLGNQSFLLNRFTSENGMRSLFERLPELYGINCNSVYVRGADRTYDGYLTVTLGAKNRDWGDRLCVGDLKRRAQNQIRFNHYLKELLTYQGRLDYPTDGDTSMQSEVENLIYKISELSNEIMPRYLLYYNPWPDHFAHYQGPFSDELVAPTGELNRLDYWLSELTNAYKTAGIYDQTLWGMSGDHGLSPVYYSMNPESVFHKMQSEGIKIKMTQISAEIDLPMIVNFNNRPNMRGFDVVVGATAGGSFVIDLFLDQGPNWKRQPLYRDLVRHKFQGGDEVDIIARLVSGLGDSLEYMTVREKPSNIQSTHLRLISTVDGKQVEAQIRREKNRVHYAFDYDLLGVQTLSPYGAIPNDLSVYHSLLSRCVKEAQVEQVETWCTEDEWRTLTSFSVKPDSVAQLSHLHDSDRSGTINLFPAKMVAYHTHKFGKHAGEDFHEKDAFVGIWGTPVKGTGRLQSELNSSIPVTLYEYLSGRETVKDRDGWGFESLTRKLGIER